MQTLRIAALTVWLVWNALLAVWADPVAVFLSEKQTPFLDMKASRISTGAQMTEDNVVLFVEPESQAMWKAPQDMEGYLYLLVRSGSEGTGMSTLIPQILYEVKIDGKRVECKAMNVPARLQLMVGKYGVYTNWIRSYDPVKIPKDATIVVTSWMSWGVVAMIGVCPAEFPEPYKAIPRAAPRPADQIFAGQAEQAAVEVNDIPDRVFEKAKPFYLAPKDIEESAEVKLNQNTLDFARSGAEALWVVQDEATGYLYLKVISGPAGDEQKFLAPTLQYAAAVDGVPVPLKIVKSSVKPEDERYMLDSPTRWLRSEQMIRLTPGCTLSVRGQVAKTGLCQTLISTTRLAVE
ncbi:MAG: hypothetical protein Kow0059_18950 [Candidatus Sumerlaeia bacterium]